jgi:acetoacetyl-CoA reductase
MKKIAVVTGATRGIGFAIAQALSKDGFFVVGISRTHTSEAYDNWKSSLSNDGCLFKCDITDALAIQKLIPRISDLGLPIHLLVNNAGITNDNFFHKMSIEDWQSVIDTNLNSLFYISQPVFKIMKANGGGKIINISSVNGQKGQAGQVNYSSSKAGVHGFTMALAQEGARSNILVNTISPGYTNTEMMKEIKPEILKNITDNIPLARLAEPAEIARVVSFLSSDSSSYITGANIPVNGGLFIG